MRMDIKDIESRFSSQKIKLLKELGKIEKRKRMQFSAILRELAAYRKHEALLKKVESRASNRLRQINRRMTSLRGQDLYDKRRINELVGEIKRLKKETPKIESKIKRMKPQRVTAASRFRLFSRKLAAGSGKIRKIEKKRGTMQKELDSLLKKEVMLKQGRIYWSAFRSKREKKKEQERPFLERLLNWEK